jgi:hypothetical protein
MLIVNIQDVRLSRAVDAIDPKLQVSILTYSGRQYTLVQTFDNDRLEPVQGLWRYLAEQGKTCLILKGDRQYSVWVEKIEQLSSGDVLTAELEAILRTQLRAINILWTEVRGLLGTSQALAFGREILANLPSLQSLQDMTTAIAVAIQPTESLSKYQLTSPQLFQLYNEIERLGIKYLGKNYTQELLDDLHRELSPQLKQDLTVWLAKQPQR